MTGFAADVVGLLVAGGRARRFGEDKRLVCYRGRPLVAHAASVLREAGCARLVVAAGDDRRTLPGTAGAIYTRDVRAHAGPLAGLIAGLRRSSSAVLVLACDTPLVRASTMRTICGLGMRSGRPVIAASCRGPEPFVAYYPRSVLGELQVALCQGRRAPHRLLGGLRVRTVRAPAAELVNVNFREDLDAIK